MLTIEMQALDPLEASMPLPHRMVLFPHGFPALIRSNDREIVRAAELNWGAVRQRFRETPIELRVLVSDDTSSRRPQLPVFRAQANLLTLIADPHNFGCCDLAAGFGFAHLNRSALARGDYVRHYFLESMIYTLLDTQHLAAIHAACVRRTGQGMLFVGDSGAGKSSLAYACARRGWTYISDDATSVVLRCKARYVVGNPSTIRFRPSASSLFPEIRGRVKPRNGKPTLEVRTENLPDVKTAYEATVHHIIFLNRKKEMAALPSLNMVPRQESSSRLFQNYWPAELAIQEERAAAIDRLLEAPAYELTYGELDPAIDLLEHLVSDGKP